MRPVQPLLFADPRPLVERLGGNFFRETPKRAGVYLMRDKADQVLYVGKAKNLQQRLRNYRIANPDKMPRRHLRMLRDVARIEFEFCPGESAALKRESRLLRSLKPKFNRAGVWPGRAKFFVWRIAERRLELAVVEVPETGWRRFGPLGGGAVPLHGTLARLLWLALNPARGLVELPSGWAQGRFVDTANIECGEAGETVAGVLDAFFWGASDDFMLWLGTQFAMRTHLFERRTIEAEMEVLKEFSAKQKTDAKQGRQLALL